MVCRVYAQIVQLPCKSHKKNSDKILPSSLDDTQKLCFVQMLVLSIILQSLRFFGVIRLTVPRLVSSV